MDRISTTVVKPDCREQNPPSWCVKCQSGFTAHPLVLLQSSPLWFCVRGARILVHSSKVNTKRFTWFRSPECNTLRLREMLHCCVCGVVQD
jgi:hypothetical protein